MFQNIWDSSWDSLMDEKTISLLNQMEKKLDENVQNENYYPVKQNVLRFLNLDLSMVKYIIVGMEPYPSYDHIHNCPQATGRSFEVSEIRDETWDYKIKQSSLRNILKAIYYNRCGKKCSMEEIRQNIHFGKFEIVNPGEWFDCMERQGVLFLNSTLTYSTETTSAFQKKLWEPFREILIPFLAERDIKWMLWGKDAQNEIGKFLPESKILKAPHPRLDSFITLNTFQYAKEIDWSGMSCR